MVYYINKEIGKSKRLKWRPKKHKELSPEWEKFFSEQGEGLYYANIASRNNNIPAKLIGKFSGGFSHTIAIMHSFELKSWFTEKQWEKIKKSWDFYYGGSKELDDSITTLVLASADEIGMVYCDFSAYQKREMNIRKPELTDVFCILAVLEWLVNIHSAEYDNTGLFFWLLYKFCVWFKFLEDPESWFCSENVDMAFRLVNYPLAKNTQPSPKEIDECHKETIVFSNLPKDM